MPVEIRQATASDIPELVQMRIGYLTADLGEISPTQSRELLFEVSNYLHFKLGRDLMAVVACDEESGGIVACAWLLLVDKPPSPRFPHGRTGVLFNVYTRTAWRRQGLARRVMECLIADARARALDVLELHATEDGYPLYRSLGFEDDSYTHVPMRLML